MSFNNIAPNNAPKIISDGGGDFVEIYTMENTTFVTDVDATDTEDKEGDGLTYSIVGGDDAHLFTIDQNNGQLSFINAPDFENPLDAGKNNRYEVDVQVEDSGVSFTPPAGAKYYNGKYYIATSKTTWEHAQAQAESYGGNLVTVNDQAELKWIFDEFMDLGSIWIGLQDLDGDEQLSNINGEDVTLTNFGGNIITFPDGTTSVAGKNNGSSAVAVDLWASAPTHYFDLATSYQYHGLIEIDPEDFSSKKDIQLIDVIVTNKDEGGGVNRPPIAVDDSAMVQAGQQVGIKVLENDSDPDGDEIRIKFTDTDKVSENGGTIKWNRNGTPDDYSDDKLVYKPADGFVGTDTFTYAISDGRGGMDMATVTINVKGVNNPPVAVDDTAMVRSGQQVGIKVLENDSDPDGDEIRIKFSDTDKVSDNGGTIKWNRNGTPDDYSDDKLVYKPADGFVGTDTFTYAISDGRGGMDMATVTINVKPPITPPEPKTGTIVGADEIHEGSSEYFKVQLDGVVTKDTYVTINIDNGSAIQSDGIIRLDEVTTLANPTTFNVSVGEKGQMYYANDSDRIKSFNAWEGFPGFSGSLATIPVGVDHLNDDFVVPEAEGDTIVVKIEAGSSMSNSFRIDALKEIQLGKYFSGITATESTENFSLNIEKIGDHVVNTGEKTVYIKDNYAVYSPIAFDLNGDGVQTLSIEQGVKFDIVNTGTAVNTGWLSGQDAFLAIDNNGNGVIDDRSELFGGGVGEGFDKLESFDSNGDDFVNASDDRFNELLVWQDANENGITDVGELTSLESAGIASISTDYTNVFKTDAQDNILGEFSSATRTDGTNLEVVDVYFQVDV